MLVGTEGQLYLRVGCLHCFLASLLACLLANPCFRGQPKKIVEVGEPEQVVQAIYMGILKSLLRKLTAG